jgi:chromosome segregation ATPase
MRDLQLVQAQQDESHHKLQQAQETKQRRVELHAALETKLEQLKYQNGQHRAELSHIRNLMSKGHRTLGMARLSTGRSGDDLRDFDRKLKQALASKQATLAHQSKQERMLSDLRNKVAIVWRLKDEANVQVDKYKQDIETLHKREEVIRHDIHKEKVQQQALDQEAASTRQDKSTLDQELHKMQQYEILAKSRIESINKDSAAMDKRHSETMESLRTKLGGHTESSKVTEDAILLMRQQITTKKQSVHETWHRMIHIQNSEGHYPSLPPTQSNTHPKFDITRLQEAAEADTKAVADEVAAKEELKISVDALEVKMADAESESQVKAQERQTLETANEEAGKLETTRREEADTFLKDLENLKKEKDTLDASISDIRSHRDTTQAIQEANKVHKRIRTLETKLAESKEELASTKACIEKSVADFEKAKAVDSSELDDIQATVDAEQQAYETAKDTAGRLIENSFNKNVDGIENSCRMLLEDTNADISRMLTGKTPMFPS